MISSPTVLFHLKVYTYYPPEILRYAFSSLSSSNEDVFSRDSSLRSRMTARENIVVKDLEEKAPLEDDSGRVILSSFRWNKVLRPKQRFAQKSLRRWLGGGKGDYLSKIIKNKYHSKSYTTSPLSVNSKTRGRFCVFKLCFVNRSFKDIEPSPVL